MGQRLGFFAHMIMLLASLLVLVVPADRDTNIRKIDWRQYFLFDTVTYVSTISTGEYHYGDLEVSLKEDSMDSWFGIYPDTSGASFGDLDGDNVEEAVVTFYTGGTAGDCSYAVLRKLPLGIRTVYIGYGYKLGARIEHDTLKVFQPIPTDYDPNCCQQSMVEEHYRLKGIEVVLTDSMAYGRVGNAHIAVREFYKLLEAKDYDGAYSLLSPSYQIKHPFRDWRNGFGTTLSTSILNDDFSYPNKNDTTVSLKIKSVDLVNGKRVSATYAGTWKLIWYNLDRGWLLDEPKIRKVK